MKKTLLFSLFALLGFSASADEGMWLPSQIESQIANMRTLGFKLKAEDIYSTDGASLKDAVVQFGGGCTGNLVSEQGLLLTNHHCGYGQIQQHSSLEHDYLTHGFWAMNQSEELPNPGLTVSILVRMEEVTDQVLAGIDETMPDSVRSAKISANIDSIIARADDGNGYHYSIAPFYYGNQYFMFVSEVFRDVRLVAAPPSAVGKFGGDTDNWMWPRHTGDFSVFRVYADRNNRPADYSPDNVPYRPRRYFEISAEGIQEGDFTWIYGYPGRTNEYILSDAADYIARIGNPHKIALRSLRLDIIQEAQAQDPKIRIQYASKAAGIANAWKKWQGEARGIERLGTVEKKRALEQEFTRWAADRPEYRDIVATLHTLYDSLRPYEFALDYYLEAFNAIELTRFAADIQNASPQRRAALAENFYKDYVPAIDRKVAVVLLARYLEQQPERFIPKNITGQIAHAGEIEAFVDTLFSQSLLASQERFTAMSSEQLEESLKNDPAVVLATQFATVYRTRILPSYRKFTHEINTLYRHYMRGLMEMQPDRTFYPDANSTLRVAYGQIGGYRPADGIRYLPQTTLRGIIEKDNPDIYDYNVPQKLRDLYDSGDFGRWATDGTVPVAFIANNHTTGGNSGSPVLDGRGRLIGLNFDRTWESTMSDVEFDPEVCRNIAVDIRYVLFLIEKLGGAGYLLDEMRIVR